MVYNEKMFYLCVWFVVWLDIIIRLYGEYWGEFEFVLIFKEKF